MFDRALTVVPGDPNTRIQRASMALDRDADIRPWQTTFAALLAANPSSGPDIEDPNYALCERTPAAASRLLANLSPEGIPDTSGANYTPAWYEGLIARWQGDVPRADTAFTTARVEVVKTLAAQPDLAGAVSLLGLIDAGLGRKEEAVAAGRRACALLPIEKDGIDGLNVAVNLAIIYAWTGETAAAVDQLAAVEKVPNSTSYGQLKLNPAWDDLRGDHRFEALVSSLAPKSTP